VSLAEFGVRRGTNYWLAVEGARQRTIRSAVDFGGVFEVNTSEDLGET
jgi:hypothetical protein